MLPPAEPLYSSIKNRYTYLLVCYLKHRKRNRFSLQSLSGRLSTWCQTAKIVVPKLELVTEILKPVFAGVPFEIGANLNSQS